MTTHPTWSPVDDDTADLLTLVADVDHPSIDREWTVYVNALRIAAECEGGIIRPNRLRPMVRNHVAPRRIGAFANRALSLGLVAYTGEYEISDDRSGRNGGKPARIMRLVAVEELAS